MLNIIVAVDRNMLIGVENKLPWRLPNDLKYFKSITEGSTVVMGSKTFESIGFPLKNRNNLVLSRDLSKTYEGVTMVNDYRDIIHLSKTEKVFVIGGSDIYNLLKDYVDTLYITFIDHEFEGDSYFNIPIDDKWNLLSERKILKDDMNEFTHIFKVYERI